MDEEKKVVKVGTQDWWLTVAMLRVAERQRKLRSIPENKPVEFSTDDINEEIDYLNRHFWKKMWALVTIGNITETDVEKVLGNEVILGKEG